MGLPQNTDIFGLRVGATQGVAGTGVAYSVTWAEMLEAIGNSYMVTDTELSVILSAYGSAAVQDVEYFATAAQGAKADTALQPENVGTAAAQDVGFFATAAQGALADSAVQTPAMNSAIAAAIAALALGTAAQSDTGDFATAAQGALADTAIQAADLAPYALISNTYTQAQVDSSLALKADASAVYTKAETDSRIQNVIGAAPEALDTLVELSASLGDDADFAGTMTTALAGKANIATTLAGYGITDAYTQAQVGAEISSAIAALGLGTASQSAVGDFAAAAHTHPIADVTGLQTALDGKAANTNVANWDAAFSWGNHASAGYISSLANAALTGVPTAPTAVAGTDTTQIATTAFVQAAIPTYTTTDIPEGTNLYYTTARVNSAIDSRVDKAFVDLLAADAATLDGQAAAYYLDYNNLVNTPTGGGTGDTQKAVDETITGLWTFSGLTSFDAGIDIDHSGYAMRFRRTGYDEYAIEQSPGSGFAFYNITDARRELFFTGDGAIEVPEGGSIRFPHTNQYDGNDGRIGAGIFHDGLDIVGVQAVASQGREIHTWGHVHFHLSSNWGKGVLIDAGGLAGAGIPTLEMSAANAATESDIAIGGNSVLGFELSNTQTFQSGGYIRFGEATAFKTGLVGFNEIMRVSGTEVSVQTGLSVFGTINPAAGQASITTSGSFGGGIRMVDGAGSMMMYMDTSGTAFHIGLPQASGTNNAPKSMSFLSNGQIYWGTSGYARLEQNGTAIVRDIYADRGDGTGVIYLGDSGARYLYYDGSNYILQLADLYVNGHKALTWDNAISDRASIALVGGVNASGTVDNASISGNLNNIIKSGFYEGTGASTHNGPTASDWTWVMHHEHSGLNGYGFQLANPISSNELYIRHQNANTWGSWAKVWTDQNDGSGSGLDADLLRGYGLTTTSTANTVVLRDSNADIYGRYFRGEYMNMSHGVSTRSSDTVFYSSTDNYIRKNNATGFRAALQVPHLTSDVTWGANGTPVLHTFYTDSSHGVRFFNGATQVGDITANDTTWFRINQNTAKNIYTPRMFRADGGFQVDGNFVIDAEGDIRANDNRYIHFGNGNDWNMWFNGSNLYLDRNVGLMYFRNGSTTKMLWHPASNYLRFQDSVRADFGSGNDFRIFHNGSNAYMDMYTGSLYLRDSSTARYLINENGTFTATGNIVAYGSVSDITAKENVHRIEDALKKVNTLDGITFNYKGEEESMTGVIAQQVRKVLPEAVYDLDPETTEMVSGRGKMAVRHGHLVGLLIEAIKELSSRVDMLEAQQGIA